jgi:NAD(P)-dependent dehydrogenase (short-subunit alcohol dehydrogenase family)
MVKDLKEVQASKEESIAGAPVKRGAAPGEIARGILFLASDESSFLTRAELIMDGGFPAY